MRAIVVGAGLSGLAAAAALAERVDDVLIVDRDTLADATAVRRGVPQGGQLHNVLSAAQRDLDRVMPGFCSALEAAGGSRIRVSTDTYVFELGIRMPERDLGLVLMSAPRPLIESTARKLVQRRSNVTLLEQTAATGLQVSRGLATGIELVGPQGRSVADADLLIDATGTGTPFPKWLGQLGLQLPLESRKVNQWFSSLLVRPAADLPSAHKAWLIFPTPPGTRGGLASTVGTDLLYISLNGSANDEPPRSYDECLRYAATLDDPTLAGVLSATEPLSKPTVFRRHVACWHHYESVPALPSGLLPIGDAYATLNPLYGQGMSVAAQQAAGLLNAVSVSRSPDELASSYFASATSAIHAAWKLAELVDTGPWRRLVDDEATAREFGRRMAADPDLHQRYVSVWHLLADISSLDLS
jgi:2-polyprenyl-6-methoxyphenol hydroxylase-like FAD-dependent oxidoreductase